MLFNTEEILRLAQDGLLPQARLLRLRLAMINKEPLNLGHTIIRFLTNNTGLKSSMEINDSQ